MKHQLTGPTAYSPTSSKLIKYLATVDHHDLIPYSELNRIAGKDVRSGHEGYSSLCTAIRTMQRDENKLFKVMVGEGMKLLTAAEAVTETENGRQRIGKATRKVSRRAQVVDIAKLEDGDRTRHLTNIAQLSAMAMFANQQAHQKLLPAVNGTPLEIKHERMLEVFKK